jgi:hypothetical protein
VLESIYADISVNALFCEFTGNADIHGFRAEACSFGGLQLYGSSNAGQTLTISDVLIMDANQTTTTGVGRWGIYIDLTERVIYDNVCVLAYVTPQVNALPVRMQGGTDGFIGTWANQGYTTNTISFASTNRVAMTVG